MSAKWIPPCRIPWRGALGLPERAHSERVQAGIARAVWRARSEVGGRPRLLAVFALWPLLSLGLASWAAARWGRGARRRGAGGRPRQLLAAWGLALRDGVPPTSYYRYRLYEPRKRGRALDYLHRATTKNAAVYPLLRRPVFRPSPLLSDKRRFHVRCLARGVATVPILLHCEDGVVVRTEKGEGVLPAGDLFVKPARSKGGRGAERWDWSVEGHYRSTSGVSCTAGELVARLARESRRQALIVQPRVLNHAALADLTRGALATARIMTCRNERGEAEPTAAVFRMPVGATSVCDNIHAGGIASGVDLDSGCLGPATALDPDSDWVASHPDTGAPIAGRALPDWFEGLALVRTAGAAFDEFDVVGWDVAFAKGGPVIVEGNSAPCVDLLQRPLDAGLAGGRFGELLAWNIDRALSALDAAPGPGAG